MENFLNQKIGDVVAQDYRAAAVFNKYGIDFCCGGHKSIGSVLASTTVPVDDLQQELTTLLAQQQEEEQDFNAWSLTALAEYIIHTHHQYVRRHIPVLTGFLEKLQRVHGLRHPELKAVRDLFLESASALEHHMVKEEQVLFKYVLKMEEAQANHESLERPFFDSINNPIQVMLQEHSTESDNFQKIAQLTNNYSAPEDACTTYRVSFSMLKDFQDDLYKHIHLENNILFPKAIRLESELL